MSFERVHRSRSQSPQSSSSTSQFAPRPFPVQEPKRPPTQEDIENEAFQQNKFEAFGLQLKEKHGTITPVEQEKLGMLQAKMDSFWVQRMERAKAQPNLLEILIRNAQTAQATEPAAPVQPKLTVGQPNDQYEQEADHVAEQVMNMASPATPNIQQQTEEEQEEVQAKPLVETITPIVQRQEALQEDEPIQAKCESCEGEEQVQRSPNGVPQVQADLEGRLNASKGGGNPLPDEVRSFMEPRFRADFSQVRVHTDSTAVQMNRELNAQAFTHKQDVYFGQSKAPAKDELTSHELTHVIQQGGSVQPKRTIQVTAPRIDISQPARRKTLSPIDHISSTGSVGTIQLRRATWLERRAWLSFFDHYLPRKFLNHYMDDTGAPLNLTQQEMIDCNPIVDLRRSPAFLTELATLQAAGGGSKTLNISGWGGALTNGTLGNFTIYYQGQLTVSATGDWNFQGTMHFYDYWDFDPKGSGSGRPVLAELKVRIAAAALPGQPFAINSVTVPVSQTSADTRVTWAGGTSAHVGDNAVRTGTDIAVGDIGGGPVGAEVGAQSSEDLNK